MFFWINIKSQLEMIQYFFLFCYCHFLAFIVASMLIITTTKFICKSKFNNHHFLSVTNDTYHHKLNKLK